jgi:predicted chitinase
MANEIANETITVEELAPLTQMDQEAKLKDILEVIESGGLSRITNIREVRSDNVPTGSIEDAVRKAYGLDEAETSAVDPDTGQEIKSADDVMADMASQGLMSRRMDGKDGDLAESVAPFSVEEDELYNFAKEAYPDNPLAAGALLATIEAESAGGNSMLESGNYSKEAALDAAYRGKFKTARKREVEKIFNDPDLTYVDSQGTTRMTKEGRVKFFNIYYSDKYRGEDYKLGNTEDGDGFRFRGRGPIQLTGKKNYKEIGDMIGVDLVQNPQLIVTDKDVALAATKAFMELKGLDKVKSAKGLHNIVGHADTEGLPKAKARWKRAQEIERKIMRETSPRPMLRPE